MFERFTDRARRVVVLAQEEARILNHNYIGTEHLLLGLSSEGDGVAAKALASMRISLEDIRAQVRELIQSGGAPPEGHIPFTPRAKKVLELSLREAIELGHSYIGTEHILLGLVREGEGVAAQVLQKLGADLTRVRRTVIQLLSGYAGSAQAGQYPDDDLAAALIGMLDRGRRVQKLAERLARHLSEALGDPSITPDLVLTGLLPNEQRLQHMEALFANEKELLAALTELELKRTKPGEESEGQASEEPPGQP